MCAWLIQWLSDDLGYNVNSILGLPYDWRLTPDVMQSRDGFMIIIKKRIEAVVEINGQPGIMVAHSVSNFHQFKMTLIDVRQMGNLVFRWFLEWLREYFREVTYQKFR